MPESSDQMLPPPAQASISSSYTRGGNRAFHNYYNDYSHIADVNLRRRLALSDVDKVPFGTCRTLRRRKPGARESTRRNCLLTVNIDVRAVLVAGAGFLLDSYSIFAINSVAPLVGLAYYSDDGDGIGDLPTTVSQALKGATSAGIVIGMVLFGWLAEYVTRNFRGA